MIRNVYRSIDWLGSMILYLLATLSWDNHHKTWHRNEQVLVVHDNPQTLWYSQYPPCIHHLDHQKMPTFKERNKRNNSIVCIFHTSLFFLYNFTTLRMILGSIKSIFFLWEVRTTIKIPHQYHRFRILLFQIKKKLILHMWFSPNLQLESELACIAIHRYHSTRLRHDSMEIHLWWYEGVYVPSDRLQVNNFQICHRISQVRRCPLRANILLALQAKVL